jgi:hypothetical protein
MRHAESPRRDVIYKFKSKACGDLILLGPQGDQLMRLLGREPAARGIVEVGAMPAAIAALEAAIADAAAGRAPAGTAAKTEAVDDRDTTDEATAVSLRQRLWPMIEMLRQAQAAGHPVVWGV